ncbi:hypothetical protein LV483_01035 [Pendulispora rubella]
MFDNFPFVETLDLHLFDLDPSPGGRDPEQISFVRSAFDDAHRYTISIV